MLGTKEIWTHEWRWAEVLSEMLKRQDFVHPYFENSPYYDKPLLSYWIMLLSSWLWGSLSEWSLRIPSAIGGIIVVWCSYFIGLRFVNKKVGLLAGWLLITNYFFIFWARTASADILTVCGIMLAFVWYVVRRDKPGFFSFSVFFLILALTSLIKGLIGAVIPVLLIMPDLFHQTNWKRYLNFKLLLALLPAIIVYLIPFSVSTFFADPNYHENGLSKVFQENIIRYFHPFDHDDPFYTYFIYLPIYLLPWSVFFVCALISAKKRWISMSHTQKWLLLATILVFLFLTLSGSRRSYYILPLVPFATLVTAEWLTFWLDSRPKIAKYINLTIIFFLVLMFNYFCILQPIYYLKGGSKDFAQHLQSVAEEIQPWNQWNVILFSAKDKVHFYMDPKTNLSQFVYLPKAKKSNLKNYPVVRNHPLFFLKENSIIVTKQCYKNLVAENLGHYYKMVTMPDHLLSKKIDDEDPVAFLIYDVK